MKKGSRFEARAPEWYRLSTGPTNRTAYCVVVVPEPVVVPVVPVAGGVEVMPVVPVVPVAGGVVVVVVLAAGGVVVAGVEDDELSEQADSARRAAAPRAREIVFI